MLNHPTPSMTLSFGMNVSAANVHMASPAHSPSSSHATTSPSSGASTPTSGNHQMHHLHHPSMNTLLNSQQQQRTLTLNTMLAMEDEYMRSPGAHTISVAAGLTTTPKKNIMTMSPACNFEAFSLHFHLPLKAAAEKFGVRATAFKKRCRAIGIRHWPYRKVRSLKRSLHELNKCKEQGALNDKQQYQFATFKKQLDKLMSPETYGIDPSGRIAQQHFGDDSEDESDDDDSCASAQSPRYGATFSDCSISPADADKTFTDFPTSTHLRTFRNKQLSHPYMHAVQMKMPQHFIPELSLHHRLHGAKEQMNMYHKYPYGGPYYDQCAQAPIKPHAGDDAVTMNEHPSSGCGLDASTHHEFMPTEMKYEDVRSLNEADDEFTDHATHMDYNNDRFFDDVFLQISPDYGCLV
uniref:RWP-RK domain-containing protein n=1 Tax=Globisporangium ultimum (strain ATCC 200006 / CBS 805.95 / DAOM BR144) TaxID=431595 RepID=K3X1U4_GLOUD